MYFITFPFCHGCQGAPCKIHQKAYFNTYHSILAWFWFQSLDPLNQLHYYTSVEGHFKFFIGRQQSKSNKHIPWNLLYSTKK